MVNIVITSNLADELLAKLMIGFVLATQEWLSMLGENLSMLGGKLSMLGGKGKMSMLEEMKHTLGKV